jgi:hypothetical protein
MTDLNIPGRPTGRAPSPLAAGYDQIEVLSADGGKRRLTRAQFEELPLTDRVRMLAAGSLRFYRRGEPVAAREAMRG